ncbi:MAG TPA: sulfite exporter TauE/SafE family protein [Solirubrobacteraceae bacterium]|nr:sulfite exporter TauE/SafE family protein [Solirubrobacteraceae bacterium]
MDPLIVVFGLGVGILVGMTGIGGGSLMTPLLIIVAGIKPVVAIGTDLAYGAVTKTVGGWRHWRKGTVDFGVSWWLAGGSVPGSLIGVWLLDRLHHRYGDGFDDSLLLVVAGALLVVSLAILARALFMPRLVAKERHTVEMTRRVKATAVGIGLVLGMVLGFTSVGSGALIGLALILVFHLTPHRVVGTDVFHAAVLLWVAGLAHFVSGNVDLVLMSNILLGSVPGVWIGTNLMTRVPSNGLRPALGCVLLGSALGVASKAGIEIPVAAIVGLPAAAGVAAWVLARGRPPFATSSRPVPSEAS